VVTSNFNKRLQIEQIRYIETVRTLDCEHDDKFADHALHQDFEHRLWLRAQCLVKQHALSAALQRAARLSRVANAIAILVAFISAILGVTYAITDSQTINIYWLLLVLLGFNFISILLWLIGISLSMNGLTAGALARWSNWLPHYLDSKRTDSEHSDRKRSDSNHPRTEKLDSRLSRAADQAWLKINFSGDTGKWLLSKKVHQLWLTYLSTGLITLLLLLMVRQYDFVWGTTLLSDATFVNLTGVLAVPLNALGLTTPTVEQIQHTQVGMMQMVSEEQRHHWAQFLLGSVFCYGIIPRLLLWLWAAMMSRLARRRFKLDFYLPYYIHLRQQLMPLASHGQVIDEDRTPPVITEAPRRAPPDHALPDDARWVAVELDNEISWPLTSIAAAKDYGQVIDRASLAAVLQQLQSADQTAVAVAVSATRSPDRGVQRIITRIVASQAQCWLVLLQQHDQPPASADRLAAWYRLAEACQIPADHVIRMRLEAAHG